MVYSRSYRCRWYYYVHKRGEDTARRLHWTDIFAKGQRPGARQSQPIRGKTLNNKSNTEKNEKTTEETRSSAVSGEYSVLAIFASGALACTAVAGGIVVQVQPAIFS